MGRGTGITAALAVGLALVALGTPTPAAGVGDPGVRPEWGGVPAPAGVRAPVCVAVSDPDYYRIPLSATRLVAGTGQTTGEAGLVFPSASPFGIALASDGSYDYRMQVRVDRLPARARGTFVAWVTTPQVDRVRRLGPLDQDGRVEGPVAWNKFLVVVTLEPEGSAAAGPVGPPGNAQDQGMDGPQGVESDTPPWAGPVVLRGMSRSGRMHTMAGHGPFEQERCAKYGYQ